MRSTRIVLHFLVVPILKLISNYFQRSFLASSLKGLSRVRLSQGQSLYIPSGWIHAVVTPSETIVLGGNFLHTNQMAMQLR